MARRWPIRGYLSVLVLAACAAGCTSRAGKGSPADYDPTSDPMVNVEATFEAKPDDPAAIDAEDVLYRNCDGNPSSLNPIFVSSTYEFYMSGLMFAGLFAFDKEMQWKVDDTFVESFEESPDHLTYTIKLHQGRTWHDGQPFTAHDVVFSWKNILDDRVPCPSVKTGTDQIASVTAIDDHTVVMVHKKALPTNPWNALFPIIPKHIYEVDKASNPDLKTGEHNNKFNRAPVGNGPYKFVRWDQDSQIILERWDEWPGEKPGYKQMVFRIIPDPNMLMLRFNKGDVDEFRMNAKQFATQSLAGSDFEKRGYKVLKPQWAYSYIGWNQDGSNPFFSDKRVRVAMAHALDLPRIRRELTYNLYENCYGIFHPTNPAFSKNIKRFEYDLVKAKALLEEAGWRIDESRGGWRHKEIDGNPVKFEFTLLIPAGSSLGQEIATVFQDDLRDLGIDMKTQVIEWAIFQQRTRQHEFQACTAAWGTGTDPDTLWNIWHSDQYKKDGSGRNYGGFQNARVDELFQKGREEFDREKRMGYYREISEIIYGEQPYLFMFNRSTMWGVATRLRGLTWSPRGIFNFSPAEMAWWTPALRD